MLNKKQLLLTAVLLFALNALYAQMKSWTWSNYKMKFQAPNSFSIKESSSSVFSAGNDNIYLTIYPKKGENLTYEKMKGALQKWARDNGVEWNSSDLG